MIVYSKMIDLVKPYYNNRLKLSIKNLKTEENSLSAANASVHFKKWATDSMIPLHLTSVKTAEPMEHIAHLSKDKKTGEDHRPAKTRQVTKEKHVHLALVGSITSQQLSTKSRGYYPATFSQPV